MTTRSLVGQLKKYVGVTGIGEPTGAGQVFSLQLGRIETGLKQVVPIKDNGAGLPTASLASDRDIWLRAYERVYVSLLNWVCPLGARADINNMDAGLGIQCPLQTHGPPYQRWTGGYEGVDGHCGR